MECVRWGLGLKSSLDQLLWFENGCLIMDYKTAEKMALHAERQCAIRSSSFYPETPVSGEESVGDTVYVCDTVETTEQQEANFATIYRLQQGYSLGLRYMLSTVKEWENAKEGDAVETRARGGIQVELPESILARDSWLCWKELENAADFYAEIFLVSQEERSIRRAGAKTKAAAKAATASTSALGRNLQRSEKRRPRVPLRPRPWRNRTPCFSRRRSSG